MENNKNKQVPNLPSDIIYKILLFLPGTSILRFKSVSKLYNSLISTDFFINSHLKSAINAPIPSNIVLCYSNHLSLVDTKTWSITNELNLNNEDRSFGGSCNGLICFYNNNNNISCWGVLVINPTTRKLLMIRKPLVELEMNFFSYTIGFVSSTNEYKIVYFYRNKKGNPNFEICTLKGNKSWRKMPQFENPNLNFGNFYPRGILSNGVLCYLGFDLNQKPWLISLDLKLEKISCNELINCDPFKKNENDFILGELNGKLSLTIIPHLISPNEKEIYIFIMNEEKQNWERKLKLVVPRMSFMMPLFFINEKYILLQDKCNEAGLYYYDLENDEYEMVFMGDYDFLYNAYPHVDSLVSLKDL